MVAELFHADGRTDRGAAGRTDNHTCRSLQSLFETLRTHLKILCYIHTLHLSLLHVSQNKQLSFICTALPVFIIQKECVYCAVRTGPLNIIQVNFSLLSVNYNRLLQVCRSQGYEYKEASMA